MADEREASLGLDADRPLIDLAGESTLCILRHSSGLSAAMYGADLTFVEEAG